MAGVRVLGKPTCFQLLGVFLWFQGISTLTTRLCWSGLNMAIPSCRNSVLRTGGLDRRENHRRLGICLNPSKILSGERGLAGVQEPCGTPGGQGREGQGVGRAGHGTRMC